MEMFVSELRRGDRVLRLVCLLSCPFPGNELIRSAACMDGSIPKYRRLSVWHNWAVSVVLLDRGVWMLGITLLEGFAGLIKY